MDAERAALERLAERLWDERRIVTLLLYRLTVSRLLLAAGERRFTPEALRAVDEAFELLRDETLEHDLAVHDVSEVPRDRTIEHLPDVRGGHQATLQGVSKALPPSLVNFLR